MGALVWLVIPAVAAVAAAIWGRWAGRRRVTGDGASLAGYERFRAAMERAPLGTAGERMTDACPSDAADVSDAAGGRPDEPRRDAPTPTARARGRSSRTADAQLAAGMDASLAAGSATTGEEDSPTGPVAGSVP